MDFPSPCLHGQAGEDESAPVRAGLEANNGLEG